MSTVNIVSFQQITNCGNQVQTATYELVCSGTTVSFHLRICAGIILIEQELARGFDQRLVVLSAVAECFFFFFFFFFWGGGGGGGGGDFLGFVSSTYLFLYSFSLVMA